MVCVYQEAEDRRGVNNVKGTAGGRQADRVDGALQGVRVEGEVTICMPGSDA